MTAPFKTWKVQPHGDLVKINERIMTVEGEIEMPIGKFPRRMSLVRLKDGRLIIFSAVALDDAGMAKLEAFGRPTFMVVPSERHRLDAAPFKHRYPAMVVVAPTGSAEKVSEVAQVETSAPSFDDPEVRYIEVAGTAQTEAALLVTASDGVSLIVNEIIGDIHDVHGLGGWLLKRMGFAGDEPHVPAPVKMQFGKHKAELAAQLRDWSQISDLTRIVVSHGDIIESDPKGVLTKLAASLD